MKNVFFGAHRLISFFVFAAAVFFSTALQSMAIEVGDPTAGRATYAPGDAVEIAVKIKNDGSKAVQFVAILEVLNPADATVYSTVKEKTQKKVKLGAGNSETLKFAFTLAKDAAAGSYRVKLALRSPFSKTPFYKHRNGEAVEVFRIGAGLEAAETSILSMQTPSAPAGVTEGELSVTEMGLPKWGGATPNFILVSPPSAAGADQYDATVYVKGSGLIGATASMGAQDLGPVNSAGKGVDGWVKVVYNAQTNYLEVKKGGKVAKSSEKVVIVPRPKVESPTKSPWEIELNKEQEIIGYDLKQPAEANGLTYEFHMPAATNAACKVQFESKGHGKGSIRFMVRSEGKIPDLCKGTNLFGEGGSRDVMVLVAKCNGQERELWRMPYYLKWPEGGVATGAVETAEKPAEEYGKPNVSRWSVGSLPGERQKGKIGEKITFEGRDFVPDKFKAWVGNEELRITSRSENKIEADLPARRMTGDLVVSHGTEDSRRGLQAGYRVMGDPVITAVGPNLFRREGNVVIQGQDLDQLLRVDIPAGSPCRYFVKIGGTTAEKDGNYLCAMDWSISGDGSSATFRAASIYTYFGKKVDPQPENVGGVLRTSKLGAMNAPVVEGPNVAWVSDEGPVVVQRVEPSRQWGGKFVNFVLRAEGPNNPVSISGEGFGQYPNPTASMGNVDLVRVTGGIYIVAVRIPDGATTNRITVKNGEKSGFSAAPLVIVPKATVENPTNAPWEIELDAEHEIRGHDLKPPAEASGLTYEFDMSAATNSECHVEYELVNHEGGSIRFKVKVHGVVPKSCEKNGLFTASGKQSMVLNAKCNGEVKELWKMPYYLKWVGNLVFTQALGVAVQANRTANATVGVTAVSASAATDCGPLTYQGGVAMTAAPAVEEAAQDKTEKDVAAAESKEGRADRLASRLPKRSGRPEVEEKRDREITEAENAKLNPDVSQKLASSNASLDGKLAGGESPKKDENATAAVSGSPGVDAGRTDFESQKSKLGQSRANTRAAKDRSSIGESIKLTGEESSSTTKNADGSVTTTTQKVIQATSEDGTVVHSSSEISEKTVSADGKSTQTTGEVVTVDPGKHGGDQVTVTGTDDKKEKVEKPKKEEDKKTAMGIQGEERKRSESGPSAEEVREMKKERESNPVDKGGDGTGLADRTLKGPKPGARGMGDPGRDQDKGRDMKYKAERVRETLENRKQHALRDDRAVDPGRDRMSDGGTREGSGGTASASRGSSAGMDGSAGSDAPPANASGAGSTRSEAPAMPAPAKAVTPSGIDPKELTFNTNGEVKHTAGAVTFRVTAEDLRPGREILFVFPGREIWKFRVGEKFGFKVDYREEPLKFAIRGNVESVSEHEANIVISNLALQYDNEESMDNVDLVGKVAVMGSKPEDLGEIKIHVSPGEEVDE